MITLGRAASIHARRQALAFLRSQEIVHQLFSEVAPRFKDRPGGYTRMVKLGPRQGDARRWPTSSSSTTCRAESSTRAKAPLRAAGCVAAGSSLPSRPRRRRRLRACASSSPSSTTVRTFAAGQRSPACARSRAAYARRSARCTDRRRARGRGPHGCRRSRARQRPLGRPVRRSAGRARGRGAEHGSSRRRRDVLAEEAPPDFHARFSARSRSYRYRLYRRRERSPFEVGRSWWRPQQLEAGRLSACAALLAGEHDFRAFTPTATQHGVFVRGRRVGGVARARRPPRLRDHR